MRNILACLTVLLLATSVTAQDAPPSGTATVYFYRLQEAYGAILKPSVYYDKIQVARMRNGRFTSLKIPADQHLITSNFKGSGTVVDLKPGETYYFRLIMSGAGLVHNSRGEILQVSPEQGKFEVSQLKASEPEDLKTDGDPKQ